MRHPAVLSCRLRHAGRARARRWPSGIRGNSGGLNLTLSTEPAGSTTRVGNATKETMIASMQRNRRPELATGLLRPCRCLRSPRCPLVPTGESDDRYSAINLERESPPDAMKSSSRQTRCRGVDEACLGAWHPLMRIPRRRGRPCPGKTTFLGHVVILELTVSLCRAGVPAPYPPEFRAEAIRLATGDRTLSEIVDDLGVSSQWLRNWVKQADPDEGRRV